MSGIRGQQNDVADNLAAFEQLISFSRFEDGERCFDDRLDFALVQQLEQCSPILRNMSHLKRDIPVEYNFADLPLGSKL